MYYRRAPFPPAHLSDCLLLLITSILLLGFIDSVTGKAIPRPFPFPADNPLPPPGALPIPDDPVKNINKDWFLSYLTVDQPKDNCVFYCRITDRARAWVELNPPLRTLWETYPAFLFQGSEEPRKSFIQADAVSGATGQDPNTNRNRYAAMSSEAYAERCRGTSVYLLLDEEIGIPEQCIWNSEEKEAIQRGTDKIEKVIEITFEAGTIKEKSRREYPPTEGKSCDDNPSRNGKRDLSCSASFSSRISTITSPATTLGLSSTLDLSTSTNPSPSLTPSPSPPASPQQTCNGIDNVKWVSRNTLANNIGIYCADAAKQGVQDKDSGSLVRSYNQGTPDELTLSMEWPSGLAFTLLESDCNNYMTAIMDGCDGNNPNNPMNWKHGGSLQLGQVKYNIFPTKERYLPGACSMHLYEVERWTGVDGPGTKRSHKFTLKVDAKDGASKIIGGSGGNSVEAGDNNPYDLQLYYATLEMKPEAQGGDYIQFTLGSQSWTTNTVDGTPRCNTGGWDGDYSPSNRNMDCFFNC